MVKGAGSVIEVVGLVGRYFVVWVGTKFSR